MPSRPLRDLALASVAALPAALAGAAPGHAQEPPPQPGLSAAVTPYLWIAGISGTVTTPVQRGGSSDVNASFGDTLSNLSGFAFMGAAELRYGRFALLGDVMTLAVESDVTTPRGALFAGGTARVTTTMGTILGAYRVLDDGRSALDLGAGVRPWSLSAKLSLHQGLLAARTIKPSASWVDPVLALRYSLRFAESWGASVYADIGGFGAGSELTWQVLGTVDYRISNSMDLRVGYRHLQIEQRRRGTEFDIGLSGPIIAATLRF